MKDRMELLATLDANYLPRLKVMLVSLWMNNPGESFRLWLLHRGIPETELELLDRQLGMIGCQLESRRVETSLRRLPIPERQRLRIYGITTRATMTTTLSAAKERRNHGTLFTAIGSGCYTSITCSLQNVI